MRVAHVVVDVPSRELDTHFDYLVPDDISGVGVGSCVLVEFARRPVVGYCVGLAERSDFAGVLKPIRALLGGPYFDERAASVARWIASEYLCPLSEAIRLFTPPGGTPRAVKGEDGTWSLQRAGVGPVDQRWVLPGPAARDFRPRATATMQRALLDALGAGPVRVAELTADLGPVDSALRSLEKAGVVTIERRRRLRDAMVSERSAPRHTALSEGQREALHAIEGSVRAGGGTLLLDGVTGSGKTEVYLRAIEEVLDAGGTACVLVPEISLTPQTVGRFRSRFADDVAVLHSRLSPGERFDQWSRIQEGTARVVVGARSALFAPMKNLRLIVIDEEHESSYKQGSSPRYHARDVAERMVTESGVTLVLGSASPSMETLHRCEHGSWRRVVLPERVTGQPLPRVDIVDLGAEFAAGNRGMFSRALAEALSDVRRSGRKAVLFLNRRGFASFLLCRECGYVPTCDSCSTSLTYHEVGSRLACHHCGSVRAVPAACPQCGSPYLRQFGAGTQRVEAELDALLPGWPVIRMDADTTKGRGAHERLLAQFEALESGILLGTQMIAKGLDYPDISLVGVITADVTLNLPDFRAGERTYQLLEQVAGRAGRGSEEGRVIVQTYWPQHPAVVAAASHDPEPFYREESAVRRALGYPPHGRLANVLIRGRSAAEVESRSRVVTAALSDAGGEHVTVLGPSPAPLTRLKGVWRWHTLVKSRDGERLPEVVGRALKRVPPVAGVSITVDIDPYELL